MYEEKIEEKTRPVCFKGVTLLVNRIREGVVLHVRHLDKHRAQSSSISNESPRQRIEFSA